MIDFSTCSINHFKAYGGGNGNKISIIYNNKAYMLKFPPSKRNISHRYTNACISEYLGCHIYQSAGFNTQNTLYGTYSVNGNSKPVVACKDFNEDGYTLIEFVKLKNACLEKIENSLSGYDTELQDILLTIDSQKLIEPQKLKEHFWDMFIMDAYLGNFDRHNGNWGFLVNEEQQKAKIAPIYDCGSCLYPQISEPQMQQVLSDENEIASRIFTFPTSAIKLDANKINYFDFISKNLDKDCTKALFRVSPKINDKKINEIIFSCSFLSETQKNFYSTMLQQRKEKIIDFSMQKLKSFSIKKVQPILINKNKNMGR